MITTKDFVLYRLKTANRFVSGEEICSLLGVSRAAVNTAVKALKNDGYVIESVTHKGYRLLGGAEKLCLGEMLPFFHMRRAEGVTVFDRVTSTNDVLKELAAKNRAKPGDCVIANHQTSGKGRRGRRFESPAGTGIYLSFLLDPKGAPPEKLLQITAWGAVAAAEAIEEVCGISCGIKWVNDLVFDSKKLCGILTELSVEGESGRVQSAVMGIGINVNQEPADFPPELTDIATSLRMICGREISRSRLCAALIAALDRMNGAFPDKEDDTLAAYRDRCAILGKVITVEKGGIPQRGIAEGIDPQFGLRVRYESGKTETVNSGEVSVKGFYGEKE